MDTYASNRRSEQGMSNNEVWIPAFAGMTILNRFLAALGMTEKSIRVRGGYVKRRRFSWSKRTAARRIAPRAMYW